MIIGQRLAVNRLANRDSREPGSGCRPTPEDEKLISMTATEAVVE